MIKGLKKAYEFDFIHDGQKVFRELLSAMSNPGTIRSIAKEADKFQEMYSPLTAIGCTLLDNEEIMYVEKNPRLAEELHSLTLCCNGELKDADYVFLSSEVNYATMEEILKNVKKGTYEDPQMSATLVILCQSLLGKEKTSLRGPGIQETLEVEIYPYIRKTIEIRQKLQIEYPLGVDLIFIDSDGNLMCVPRLCKVVKQEEE